MNKTKLTMTLLALLAALALSDTGTAQLGPGMTQVKTKKQHQVVILWGQQYTISPGYGTTNQSAQMASAYVWNYTVSAGYKVNWNYGNYQYWNDLTQLSDALAQLLNDGFEITHQDQYGLQYTLVRGQ